MDECYKSFLKQVRPTLCQALWCKCSFLRRLLEREVINKSQFDQIQEIDKNSKKKAATVLDILENRRNGDFKTFCEILLSDEDESGAAEIIERSLCQDDYCCSIFEEKDTVPVKVDVKNYKKCKMSEAAEDASKDEYDAKVKKDIMLFLKREITEQYASLYQSKDQEVVNSTLTEAEEKREVLWRRLQLKHADVQSLILHFGCMNLPTLDHLLALNKSGELTSMFHKQFVTTKMLNQFHLREVMLETTIRRDHYLSHRNYLQKQSYQESTGTQNYSVASDVATMDPEEALGANAWSIDEPSRESQVPKRKTETCEGSLQQFGLENLQRQLHEVVPLSEAEIVETAKGETRQNESNAFVELAEKYSAAEIIEYSLTLVQGSGLEDEELNSIGEQSENRLKLEKMVHIISNKPHDVMKRILTEFQEKWPDVASCIESIRPAPDPLKDNFPHHVDLDINNLSDRLLPGSVPLILPGAYGYDSATGNIYKQEATKNGDFYIVEEGKQLLKKIKKQVSILGIFGQTRSGKSFLTSRLLGKDGAFKIGHTYGTQTIGIWMSTAVLEGVRGDNKEEFCILFLDSEGTGSVSASSSVDAKIASLMIVLCTQLVYNTLNVPAGHNLDQLRLYSNLAQRILSLSGMGKDELKHLHLPNILWLLRDASKRQADGTNKNLWEMVQHLAETRTEIKEKYDLSWAKTFPCFDIDALPAPHHQAAVLENLTKHADEVSSEFKEELSNLLLKLYDNCRHKVKYGVDSHTKVTGIMLSELITSYVDSVNKPSAIPNLRSAWDFAVDKLDGDEIDDIADQYKKDIMDYILTSVNPDGDWVIPLEVFNQPGDRFVSLVAMHNEGVLKSKEKLTEYIRETSRSDGTKLQRLEKELEHKLGYIKAKKTGKPSGGKLKEIMRRNKEVSQKYCEDILEKAKAKIQLQFKLRPNSTEDEMEIQIEHIRTSVLNSVRGPAKETIIEEIDEHIKKANFTYRKQASTDQRIIRMQATLRKKEADLVAAKDTNERLTQKMIRMEGNINVEKQKVEDMKKHETRREEEIKELKQKFQEEKKKHEDETDKIQRLLEIASTEKTKLEHEKIRLECDIDKEMQQIKDLRNADTKQEKKLAELQDKLEAKSKECTEAEKQIYSLTFQLEEEKKMSLTDFVPLAPVIKKVIQRSESGKHLTTKASPLGARRATNEKANSQNHVLHCEAATPVTTEKQDSQNNVQQSEAATPVTTEKQDSQNNVQQSGDVFSVCALEASPPGASQATNEKANSKNTVQHREASALEASQATTEKPNSQNNVQHAVE